MDAKHSHGESRLLISRSALLHNARVLRRNISPGVKICAMIKADAYGHSATIVADALCNLRQDFPEQEQYATSAAVDQFAVATIDEAAQLPVDINLPVTILRQVENVFVGRQREAVELAIRRGWTLTLATPSAADDVARVALACDRRASIHVMIDTGMTRCGVSMENLPALIDKIDKLPSLRLISISTHFANSEIAHDPFTMEQLRKFHDITEPIVKGRTTRVIRHAANTGGIFFTPRAHFDMVRPGIGLYGIDPTCKPNMLRPLRPVMKWTAPLTAIHHVKANTSIGYNQTFIAPRDMRVGLVPVGYADGYLRALSNKGVMIITGQHGDSICPVVGRVSMDFTTIDLSGVPHVVIGDTVTIIDDDPVSRASAYEMARLADTIPYELFTRIGPRVRRVGVDPEDSKIAPAELEDRGDDQVDGFGEESA